MATLTAQAQAQISNGLQRHWSRLFERLGINSPQLLAAVAATDTWIDNNAASYNSALPVAFRAGATLEQKTLLFCAVALARVSIALLRATFGEVD